VDAPGHKFLARPRFAGDQDGIAAPGHDLGVGQQGLHEGALGDDLRERPGDFPGLGPAARRQSLEEPLAFIGPLDGQKEQLVVHRLDEVVVGPQADGADGGGDVVHGREDDEFRPGLEGLGRFQDLHAVRFRHQEVEKDDVIVLFPDAADGLPAVVADLHVPQPPPFQQPLHRCEGDFLVVNDEDLHKRCLPVSSISFTSSSIAKGFATVKEGGDAGGRPCRRPRTPGPYKTE